MAMLHAPKAGVETMEKVIMLSAAAFAANIGISEEDLPNISKISPSSTTLKQLLVKLAVESVLMTSEEIKDKQLGLICDKGEDKSTGASFVKLLSFYCRENKRVKVTCFGIKHAGSTSDAAAHAIDHSLKLFELHGEICLVITSSTTDAGGGGVNRSLYISLVARGRAVEGVNYLHPTCCLHAMNLMLSVPCETLLGTGGLKKRTFLQVLHTAYTLKGLYSSKVWAEIWLLSTGLKWVDIKCPVLSRWEHVGEAAAHLKKNFMNWITVSLYIIDLNNVGTNKNDIASYLYSYLNKDMLYAQILFVNAYIVKYYYQHFQWLKHVDTKTKCAGFIAIYMAVHYFVMDRDLKALQQNWRTREAYNEFVSKYPDNSPLQIDDFVSNFFQIAQARMTKHFEQWRTQYLPLCLGDDHPIAKYIANWLLGRNEQANIPLVYNSKKHRTNIDALACARFLVQGQSAETHTQKEFYQLHREALVRIADEDEKLWKDDTNKSVSVAKFEEYIEDNWFKIAANSQLAKQWVKDSNECTYTNKDEKMSNIFALLCSHTVFQFGEAANQKIIDRERKASKNFTKGKKGERIDKRTGVTEIVKDNSRDNVRGSLLGETIIKETIKIGEKLNKMSASEEQKKKIYIHLMDINNQYEKVQEEAVIEEFAGVLHGEHKDLNAIQKQTGYEITSYGRKEIKFSKVLTKHIELVKEELEHREICYDESMKIMKLKELLRADEKRKREEKYLLDNGIPSRPEDINLTCFLPLHRDATEWGNAYHFA